MTVPEPWQDTLRQAILEKHGTLKGYARHRAGKGASADEVENKRRQIGKWLQEVKPGKPDQQTIKELGLDPEIFPRKPPPVTLAALAGNQETALGHLESLADEIHLLADAVKEGMGILRQLHSDVEALRNHPGSPGSTRTGKRRAG